VAARLAHEFVFLLPRLDRRDDHFAGDFLLRVFDRLLDDRGFRVADVPLAAALLEHKADRRPGPQRRVALDPEAQGEAVRGLETDAPDVGGQAVRVGPHQFNGLVAVGLVDADGAGCADAVFLQKQHDAAHRLLLLPAFADALQAARADALHLLEKGRALVDDRQGTFAKDFDDLAGEVRADALDQAGAGVVRDAL